MKITNKYGTEFKLQYKKVDSKLFNNINFQDQDIIELDGRKYVVEFIPHFLTNDLLLENNINSSHVYRVREINSFTDCFGEKIFYKNYNRETKKGYMFNQIKNKKIKDRILADFSKYKLSQKTK